MVHGIYTVGSTIYAFNYLGLMVKNAAYGGTSPQSGYYTVYYFGSNGKRVEKTGWENLDGAWYYFNKDYTLEDGFLNLDGNTYYLGYEYRMLTTSTISDMGIYKFNSSGVLTSVTMKQNGWVSAGNSWLYTKDGRFVTDGIHYIDGKYYGFNFFLAKNETVYSNGDHYFCGSDGTVVKKAGWKTDADGYQYYTDANGRCLTDIQVINGKTYYFDFDGRWQK